MVAEFITLCFFVISLDRYGTAHFVFHKKTVDFAYFKSYIATQTGNSCYVPRTFPSIGWQESLDHRRNRVRLFIACLLGIPFQTQSARGIPYTNPDRRAHTCGIHPSRKDRPLAALHSHANARGKY